MIQSKFDKLTIFSNFTKENDPNSTRKLPDKHMVDSSKDALENADAKRMSIVFRESNTNTSKNNLTRFNKY